MTHIELERRAFIQGDTRLCALIVDVVEQTTDELEDAHADELKSEFKRGYEEGVESATPEAAAEKIAALEQELYELATHYRNAMQGHKSMAEQLAGDACKTAAGRRSLVARLNRFILNLPTGG